MKHRTIIAIGLATAGTALWVSAGPVSASGPDPHAQAPGQHRPHMEHRFDDPEAWAKSFDDPARDAWQMPDRVIAALELRPGHAVADIGAGTGYFTVRLARSPVAPRVFAVDIEPAMVEHLRKRAAAEGLDNVTAVLAGADSPNLSGPVDRVLIVDTYHHLPDRVRYFRALRQSLKADARVAIVDWKRGGPMGPPEAFRPSPDEIRREMTEAGYRLLAEHDFLPNQIFLIFEAAG
jgi:cyclopropane fatty-acyl-phospholipid synthase-like methyltransferase